MSTNLQIVKEYIDSYNKFDLSGMLKNVSDEIIFKNIVDGEVNLSILGLGGFREQAHQAIDLFAERKQTILAIEEKDQTVEVTIEFTGILSMELPAGGRAGDRIQLNGKSIFELYEGKIVSIQDIS